jgi:transposase
VRAGRRSRHRGPRFSDLKGRVRRIMIIALARKLVIALWRYVETGKAPDIS